MQHSVLPTIYCAVIFGLVYFALRAIFRLYVTHFPAPPPFDTIACNSTSDGIIVQSLDGLIVWANPAYLELMQRSLSEVTGRNPLSFCLPEEDRLSDSAIKAFRYDVSAASSQSLQAIRNVRADGTVFWNQLSINFYQTRTGETLAVLVCRDISDQVAQEHALQETTDKLAHLATHDSLTGVANRTRFNSFIAAAVEQGTVSRPAMGLLQIDLDKFKTMNDLHGHAAGDVALKHVAHIIATNLRKTDLVARLGGDEFVVVCTGISGAEELLRIARMLCDAVKKPFTFEGKQLHIGISIGAAMADADDKDSLRLLQKSDFALYEVKRNGRGDVAIYDARLHKQVLRTDRLKAQLLETIENNGLDFYFQPAVDLQSQKVRGFEALVRWHHPTQGILHPGTILPLADEMNLLRHIDLAATGAAANLRKRLVQNGYDDVRVSINGSRHLLCDAGHAALLPAHVARVGVDPAHMVIELSEGDIFADPARVDDHLQAVSRIIDMGFKVLIDDFGAGYTGLLHVERLSLAGIKVDKNLIRHLDRAPTYQKITSMLLEFGRDQVIYSIATGIETATQANMVRSLGGVVGQGNHFARAMPAQDVITWLRNRNVAMDATFGNVQPIAPRLLAR